MYDQIYFKYGVEPLEFEIACNEHNLLKVKDGENAPSLSKNALNISNNLI